MKKALILSIFLLIISVLHAQNKFQAQFISIRLFNDSLQQFEDWSEWEPSDVIMNVTRDNIHIYSNYEQDYTIITQIYSVVDSSLHRYKSVIMFDALDVRGIRCTIELMHIHLTKNYMFIRWKDLQLAYQFKKL